MRPTYAFAGASTIDTAATLVVQNAPAAGTNATITNPLALWIQAGKSLFQGVVHHAQTSLVAARADGVILENGNTGWRR